MEKAIYDFDVPRRWKVKAFGVEMGRKEDGIFYDEIIGSVSEVLSLMIEKLRLAALERYDEKRKRGPGINLTIETLDGLNHHFGPSRSPGRKWRFIRYLCVELTEVTLEGGD